MLGRWASGCGVRELAPAFSHCALPPSSMSWSSEPAAAFEKRRRAAALHETEPPLRRNHETFSTGYLCVACACRLDGATGASANRATAAERHHPKLPSASKLSPVRGPARQADACATRVRPGGGRATG